MRRRDFISFSRGLALAGSSLVAHAQAPAVLRRVGVLLATKQGDPEGMVRLAAFTKGLAEAGWTEGRNVHIDVGWLPGDANLIPAAAADMVALKPDVIFAATTPLVAALKAVAGPIPIVFALVSDPIGSGFVQTLARPGGNITGILNFEASLVGKWLEILTALGVRRATALFNPQTSNGKYYLDTLNVASASTGVATTAAEVRSDEEIDAAIGNLRGDGGLIVMPDGFTTARRRVIITKAVQHRVPASISTIRNCRSASPGSLICRKTRRSARR
jgi:putative ABC transport system substrate-binding protein